MPTAIAIICTLDELIPYSVADLTTRYFSINLSMGLTGTPALPSAAAARILQPWNLTFGSHLSPLPFTVYADSGASGATPSGGTVPFTVVSPPVQPVQQVVARLNSRFNAAVTANDTGYFDWADQPGLSGPVAPGENWSRLLAHASTYTAPVPQSLKLAFLIKIDANLLKVNKTNRLFVAPVLTDGVTTYSPGSAPATPTNQTATWPYPAAPAGYTMSAYMPEYLLPALPDPTNLPAPHFIDPNTYWIGTSDGKDQVTPPESAASEDWRTTLEQRAGEVFDLGQRIIVLLRAIYSPASNPTSFPTFSDVDLIRDAVLSVLRDTADFGLRYGPDGTSILRFIFQRAGIDTATIATCETALTNATPTLSDWKALLSPYAPVMVFISPGKSGDQATSAYMMATLDMLDAVQTALATDSILAALLEDQWAKYLPPSSWASVSQAVQGELASLTSAKPDAQTVRSSRILRRRMLLANMGTSVPASPAVPIWAALTTTPNTGYTDETAAVTLNLSALITGYFRGRFGITVADPYASLFGSRQPAARWPGTSASPNPDLTVNATAALTLAGDATAFAGAVLFPDPVNQAARASHPIILQIGDTTDQPVPTAADVERKIAGVGLIVREQGAAWTSADVANLYIQNTASGFDKLVENVAVPIRLHKRNNLKQPILSYNSSSLVGQDPSDPTSAAFPSSNPITYPPSNGDDWSQMFQFRLDPDVAGTVQWGTDTHGNSTLTIPPYLQPGDTLADWKRLPALKVGLNYDFLPFVIGNSNALPPLLASVADPFTLVAPSVFAQRWQVATTPSAPGAKPLMSGYLRTVKYLRRVAVGAPRIRGAHQNIQQDLPLIPPSVVPLARDFVDDTGTPVLLIYNSSAAASARTPSTNSFTFQLRPPACDLETWDRWVAGLGPTYRNTRISVATGVTRFNSKSTSAPDPPDLSIDDPAVTALSFSLSRIYPPPQAGDVPLPSQTVTLPPLAALGATITGAPDITAEILLSPVQFSGVTVTCSVGGPTLPVPVGNAITMSVPLGQVWKLSVTPSVPDANKFEGLAAKALKTSFDLLIEAAAPGMFSPIADPVALNGFQRKLWRGLSVTFADNQLQASLTPWGIPGTVDADRDLIRLVDLRRQVWRWMGRPIAPLPADWNNPTSMSALDADPPPDDGLPHPLCSRVWELGSFAERPDDDCAINETAVNFAKFRHKKDGTPAPFVPVFLHSSDLSTDLRAQYYRFGIDVHSRYEGLPGFAVAPVRAQISVAPANGSGFTRWVRGLVPPRTSGQSPKPKVLLVIPMTEPDSTGTRKLPDLLVIANEPWFAMGGLAEELRAELDLARDPSVPLSTPTLNANPIPEFGPNPILSATSLNQPKVGFSGSPAPADPVGATFDQDSSAAFFGNTCFRLKSSMLLSSASAPYGGVPVPDGLEHFEAKIRFRRVVNGAPFGLPILSQSDLTDAFWVEFQSSFIHCSVTPTPPGRVAIDDLRFSITGGTNLSFTWNKISVTPVAGPPASSQLQLWALVMRSIYDVTGNVQMAAVNILGPGFAFPTPTSDSPDLVVYLLEVLYSNEYHGTFVSGIDNAAALLFPDPTQANPNAMVRISRCSPAIYNQARPSS